MRRFTHHQIDALKAIIDIAEADQRSYLQTGDPWVDHGDEWPAIARAKAGTFRCAAEIYLAIGTLPGRVASLYELANLFEWSATDFERAATCVVCGKRSEHFVPGGRPGINVECTRCACSKTVPE